MSKVFPFRIRLVATVLALSPCLSSGDEPSPMQLFDLQNDPGEQHDVAAQHPEEVKRLLAAYEEMNKDVPVVPDVKRVPKK